MELSPELRALRDTICIVGVGSTEYSRNSRRSALSLAAEATQAAARDAGIDPQAIDGFLPYGSAPDVQTEPLSVCLGTREINFTPTIIMGGGATVASFMYAALALNSGLARYVLIWRANNGATARLVPRFSPAPSPGLHHDFEVPYGWDLPVQHYAILCRRHMAQYGTTREHLAQVALTMRKHANLNPGAVMYGRPLTLDQYMTAPPIATPFHLFDCCLQTDGGCAVILARADRARDLRQRPVYLAGFAEGHPPSPDYLPGRTPFFSIGLTHAAPRAWAMAGMGPSDMDAAMIYDCFTFVVILQLEQAGFCREGEGGDFVSGGRIALGGELPINTHGGLLSEAHLNALNHVVEATQQLRGLCGPRQIRDAETIAVTSWGDLGDGGLAILHN